MKFGKGTVSMQKTFIKYTFLIVTTAICLILFINFLFSLHSMEAQQFATFQAKIEQVIHTLESNQRELSLMNESLDEDYLTRAKAAAYVLDREQEISMDVAQLQYLAELLNVDELHVIDENGIIAAASVSKYVGINMDDHEQTRAFLAILESGDENAYLIQDAMPNAAEGRIMKYVGVARKGQKGIVQVGFEPKRQLEAESRNTYEYIFSKFPTDVGEELFVADIGTGEVLGHSDGMDREFTADYYAPERLLGGAEGAYQKGEAGEIMYVVSRVHGNVVICAAMPGSVLLRKLLRNTFSTFLYLALVEIAVILLLDYLVRRKVINGIHDIIEDLGEITNGNLDTTVAVGGNREFEELSRGINIMVKSIMNVSNRISAIIEISGIPLAAFEYKSGNKPVFVTSGVKELLEIPDGKTSALYRSSDLFDQYIHSIVKCPIEGETDIYRISDSKYVRIHMSETTEGWLGVITDVSMDILEKQRMQYENTHDPLTGLCQYQYFKQLAAGILRGMAFGKIAAIAMLDLDFFKSINDTFGHNAGDRYLQGFSKVMQSMPGEHFLTARRSGDEFCMMIYDCGSREQVTGLLDQFYEELGKIYVELSDTESRTISASCGFAWTTDPGASVAELLSHADEALYERKREEKGHYAEYVSVSGDSIQKEIAEK